MKKKIVKKNAVKTEKKTIVKKMVAEAKKLATPSKKPAAKKSVKKSAPAKKVAKKRPVAVVKVVSAPKQDTAPFAFLKNFARPEEPVQKEIQQSTIAPISGGFNPLSVGSAGSEVPNWRPVEYVKPSWVRR